MPADQGILPRWKKFLFSSIVLFISVVIAAVALLLIDLHLHEKYSTLPNRRGYRGELVAKKRENELRFVLLGGSTAFGYGVSPEHSISAYLETELERRLRRPVSVVNLAFNNQGAYSFKPTLEDYESLDYDAVILYEGYNDLTVTNRSLFRHDSPIFRLTGYYPVLPIIAREKLMVMRYGDIDKAYAAQNKKVFRPGAGTRPITAADLQKAATIEQRKATRFYLACVAEAIRFARERDRIVYVVTQPYIAPAHREQQDALRTMLAQRFPDPNVHHVDLGNAIDLSDTSLAYDGMHLVPAGNKIIADRLAEAIVRTVSP